MKFLLVLLCALLSVVLSQTNTENKEPISNTDTSTTKDIPKENIVDEEAADEIKKEVIKDDKRPQGSEILDAAAAIINGYTASRSDKSDERYEDALRICDLLVLKSDQDITFYTSFETKIDQCLDKRDILDENIRNQIDTLFDNTVVQESIEGFFADLRKDTETREKLNTALTNFTTVYTAIRDRTLLRLKALILIRKTLVDKLRNTDEFKSATRESLETFIKARLSQLEELASRIFIALLRAEHRRLKALRDFYQAIKEFDDQFPDDAPTTQQARDIAGPVLEKYIIADIMAIRLRNAAKKLIERLEKERDEVYERIKNFILQKVAQLTPGPEFREAIADRVRSFLSARADVEDVPEEGDGKKRIRVIAKEILDNSVSRELFRKIVLAAVRSESSAAGVELEDIPDNELKRQGTNQLGVIAIMGDDARVNNEDNSAGMIGVWISFVCALVVALF